MGNSSSKQFEYGVWVGEDREGETRVLRHPKIGDKELPKEPVEGINTISKTFEYAVNLHGNRPFLGTRRVISKDQFGEYEFKTYNEINELVKQFATAINVLYLCPEIETPYNGIFRFLGIYSKNREEWLVTDLACHFNSVTVVTLYDTLGDDTIGFVLDQTKMTSIVLENTNLKKIFKLKKESKTGSLRILIMLDQINDDEIKEAELLGFIIYTYSKIFELVKGKECKFTPATPETIATICYTSGTTGTPKGSMVSHSSLLAEIAALPFSDANIKETDVHLSYLPLAHIMERAILTAGILKCVSIGFYSGNPQKLIEDAQALKPTVFLGVPRVYQRIYDVINNTLKRQGYFKRAIAERAINSKLGYYHNNGTLHHSIWDRLFFNRTKNALGGNVRLMVTGSAPISAETLAFLKICFSCPILEGYGQTESCGAATITQGDDNTAGHVGGPIASAEIKLVDAHELKYLSTDKNEEGEYMPRGEIYIRGPILFKGYFNDKEKTAETFDGEGWLKTGDIGCILPNGSLKILDRVKNIFKLSQGEYVAPEKLESALGHSKYISQIMVHGESIENYVIALIVPHKKACVEYFQSEGKKDISEENVHEYYNDEGLKKDILKDLEDLGRSKDFKGFEVIKKVYLIHEHFTIDNRLLTPTMKVKRHEVKNKYLKQIKEMYSQK
jgi:long-chain acyl-CoA synthetase